MDVVVVKQRMTMGTPTVKTMIPEIHEEVRMKDLDKGTYILQKRATLATPHSAHAKYGKPQRHSHMTSQLRYLSL